MADLGDVPQSQETQRSNGDGGHSITIGLTPTSFQTLSSDLGSLIQTPDEDNFSDLTVIVDGRKVSVHRCILAARCPGFRKVLAEVQPTGKGKKLELELNSIVVKDGKIGFEAFTAVMGYVYGGRMEPWPVNVACYHSSCEHLTCRPAIDYVLEVLRASLLFGLPEVKTLAQVWLGSHQSHRYIANRENNIILQGLVSIFLT